MCAKSHIHQSCEGLPKKLFFAKGYAEIHIQSRVVTRTIADGWMVGRWPLGRLWLERTVASVIELPGGKTLVSARTHSSPPLPSPSCALPSPFPCGRSLLSAQVLKNIFFFNFIFIYLLNFIFVVVAHLKRGKKNSVFGFWFSIPKIPKLPELRGWSHEKKKAFSA
jgi:hypothetical protein